MENKVIDLLIKTCRDPKLKEELKKDPKKFLREKADLEVAESSIVVLENTPKKQYFVLFSPEKLESLTESAESEKIADSYRKQADPSFRKRVKEDPKSTLQKEFNLKFPQDCTIEIVEGKKETLYLVLPAQNQIEEMSEEELAEISGGMAGEGLFVLLMGAQQLWEHAKLGATRRTDSKGRTEPTGTGTKVV